eukprot:COSAG01_NODE_16592_length_1221_cov_725.169190_1_plen_118_part_10
MMALINTTRRRHPHSTHGMRMSAIPELLLAHLSSISTSEHQYVHLQRHGHPPIAIALLNSPTHTPERKNSVPPPPAAAAARKRDLYLVAMLHVSVTVLPCSVLLSGWCSQDELKLSGW